MKNVAYFNRLVVSDKKRKNPRRLEINRQSASRVPNPDVLQASISFLYNAEAIREFVKFFHNFKSSLF